MKKILVTILVTGALSVASYGQGTISFANNASSLVRIQTSPTDSTLINMPAGGGYVQLLWAPIGTVDLGAFTAVTGSGVSGGNNSTLNGIADYHGAPGRFNGGTVTVPGITPGGGVALVVRAWTGSAASYDEAVNEGGAVQVGYSSIFTLTATGNPVIVPPGTPPSLFSAPGFTGVTLAYVPEPTSMALAGLGAAALLIFRRRK